ERSVRFLAFGDANAAHGHERATGGVIDQLRADVLERPEHDQARPRRRAGDLFPDAQVPAVAFLVARLRRSNAGHYLPPALPALRRTCSPAYLMPFPLYGSGGRRLRSSAATWPTFS